MRKRREPNSQTPSHRGRLQRTLANRTSRSWFAFCDAPKSRQSCVRTSSKVFPTGISKAAKTKAIWSKVFATGISKACENQSNLENVCVGPNEGTRYPVSYLFQIRHDTQFTIDNLVFAHNRGPKSDRRLLLGPRLWANPRLSIVNWVFQSHLQNQVLKGTDRTAVKLSSQLKFRILTLSFRKLLAFLTHIPLLFFSIKSH